MMGGNAHMMIHECRRKHHFPSNQPDQILQDLTQSITFRKEKFFYIIQKGKLRNNTVPLVVWILAIMLNLLIWRNVLF